MLGCFRCSWNSNKHVFTAFSAFQIRLGSAIKPFPVDIYTRRSHSTVGFLQLLQTEAVSQNRNSSHRKQASWDGVPGFCLGRILVFLAGDGVLSSRADDFPGHSAPYKGTSPICSTQPRVELLHCKHCF